MDASMLQAEFARIRNENAAMMQELGALRTQAATQAAELQQVQAATTPLPTAPVPPPAPAAPIIDTRYIGKPDSFDGVKGWRDWSTVFTAYCSAINPGLQALMQHAEHRNAPHRRRPGDHAGPTPASPRIPRSLRVLRHR